MLRGLMEVMALASQSEELAQVMREFVDSMNSGEAERVLNVLSSSNELLVLLAIAVKLKELSG